MMKEACKLRQEKSVMNLPVSPTPLVELLAAVYAVPEVFVISSEVE